MLNQDFEAYEGISEASQLFSSFKPIRRFSEYVLKDEEEDLFIVPADNAREIVDPKNASIFDYYPNVLLRFIELVQKVKTEKDIMIVSNHILNFCNKYGLFNLSGLYIVGLGGKEQQVSIIPYGRIVLSYYYGEKSKRTKNTSVGGRVATIKRLSDYENIFYPKTWVGKRNIIDNYHCENVRVLIIELLLFDMLFLNKWMEFQEGNHDPLAPAKKGKEDVKRWHEVLSSHIRTQNIKLSMGYDGGWRFKWIYRSLIDAFKIMFITNIVESKERIRFCTNPGCGIPFRSTQKNHKYCSKSCNDAARSRRYYDKHKKKTRKE